MNFIEAVREAKSGKVVYSKKAKIYMRNSESCGLSYPEYAICPSIGEPWEAVPSYVAFLAEDWEIKK